MIWLLLVLSSWTIETYDWYKCYETGVYDVYVMDESLCVDDTVKVIDGLIVKVLPRFSMSECWGGPGTLVCYECLELYDYDWDDDVDLMDLWLYERR